ncbi:MAG: hypothetical protein NVS2B6_20550 [Thermoleophilaceae bacterium]
MAVGGREEVPLSSAQAGYVTNEATTGVLARRAVGAAALTPIVIGVILWGITRLAARVPLIGWLLGIYGLIFTVMGALAGALISPFVFLLVLPVMLSTRRRKLREDIAAGVAVKQSGSFKVKDELAAGGKISVGDTNLALSKEQVEALRPALVDEGDGLALNGSVLHTPHQRLLLAVHDPAGRELVRVG